MKNLTKYFFVFGLVFLVSCFPPKNKEEYLSRFEAFVNRVEENHEKYNKKDWEWANSQFEKYNQDWYLKFKGDYTLEEQIKIKGLILKYNTLKNEEDIGKVIKELFEDDIDEIKQKVKEYIDNDMDEDLDKLLEGAEEIGDSAVKVIEEIIEKIDNSF
jgi:hypothetical protein